MKGITEIIAFALILILVVNIVLLATRKMPPLLFFVIIGIAALIAYRGIPYLRKRQQ